MVGIVRVQGSTWPLCCCWNLCVTWALTCLFDLCTHGACATPMCPWRRCVEEHGLLRSKFWNNYRPHQPVDSPFPNRSNTSFNPPPLQYHRHVRATRCRRPCSMPAVLARPHLPWRSDSPSRHPHRGPPPRRRHCPCQHHRHPYGTCSRGHSSSLGGGGNGGSG